jgi:hypothetical protein
MIRRDWRRTGHRQGPLPSELNASPRAATGNPGREEEIAKAGVQVAYRELERAASFDTDAGLADIRRRTQITGVKPKLGRLELALVTAVLIVMPIGGAAIVTTLGEGTRATPAASADTAPSPSMSARVTEPGPPVSGSIPATELVPPGTEIASGHPGSPAFTDPRLDAATVSSIPFGTRVQVACFTLNESRTGGMSVFYLIETPPWNGLFAPANTFANGNPAGAAGAASIDPKVVQCPGQ